MSGHSVASLKDLIRKFQNGGLSDDEFVASFETALAQDPTTPSQAARVVIEENTRFPFPPAVYAEVMRRIERRGATQYDGDGDGDGATDATRLAGTETGSMYAASPEPGTLPQTPATKGVGDTLNGRFVLEECLGVGGMGTVYKALDLRKLEASDRRPYIAIKVLNLQFSGHPKSLMALQREARKAQTLAHRNIVTVYDFDRDGPVVFLTMEYLSGSSLNHVLKAPGFAGMPMARAMPIIQGMGNALAYAHERGFVHCDFKPANVFLTGNGEVKVIDFGIARGFLPPADESDRTVFDPGSLGGMTPAYASPEMFEHREPDPRDDIYALACVTYELLSGKHPYQRLSANQAREAGLKPAPLPQLGRTQWKTLREALSLDRETRTPTVARFLQGMSVAPAATSGPARRSGPLVAGGVLTALAGVAALGYYAWQSQRPAEAPATDAGTAAPVSAAAPAELSMADVGKLLAAVPCSLLAGARLDQTLHVRGYLAESVGAARLREQLSGLPGAKALREVVVEAQPLAADKCEVASMIAPYWSGNRQGDTASSLQLRGKGTQLTEGAPMVLDLRTPAQDSYVYVDYFAADGKVAHMVPSQRIPAHQAPPAYHATIGDSGDWIVSAPFGNELVVMLTTPAPLFASRRAEVESRQDYLRALEKPLAQMARTYGRDRISADLVQISTRAR
ncbi:Serine/threonine protein kinase [Cupriavidus taiwanensis]|uniref:Serine/threonine protein kinase n=1 Tax=Cupriavidus taiwanensis TaxID=164546 RepID=A0A375DZN0_9BURK|nr:serine/threonine protein kinase [Cupriavidus taiwanensis]SOZ54691.1 Serine/threonine protein kinase [Cupriavidus taiwanensis]SOZ55413.1 Serine/threonine protein kinase [Cupriavidus taiwanensis]SOZ58028.1 Serine/threonine protein kinase [Cupriavidus taiwanensis]SPA05150.1 Serine/threonine protein kinase [Cupriavidus taiwanensis]